MQVLIALFTLLAFANAQFGGFFDQMFNGGGHQEEEHHQGGRRQPPNNPSDASHYLQRYDQCTSCQYSPVSVWGNEKKVFPFC